MVAIIGDLSYNVFGKIMTNSTTPAETFLTYLRSWLRKGRCGPIPRHAVAPHAPSS